MKPRKVEVYPVPIIRVPVGGLRRRKPPPLTRDADMAAVFHRTLEEPTTGEGAASASWKPARTAGGQDNPVRIVRLLVGATTASQSPKGTEAHWRTIGRLNAIMAQRLVCGACDGGADGNKVSCSAACPHFERCESRVA